MWPWSTIRRLKSRITQVEVDRTYWERQTANLSEEVGRLRAAEVERDAALARNGELVASCDRLKEDITAQREVILELRAKIVTLTTRGAGGKFVKVDSASGKSSGEVGH